MTQRRPDFAPRENKYVHRRLDMKGMERHDRNQPEAPVPGEVIPLDPLHSAHFIFHNMHTPKLQSRSFLVFLGRFPNVCVSVPERWEPSVSGVTRLIDSICE